MRKLGIGEQERAWVKKQIYLKEQAIGKNLNALNESYTRQCERLLNNNRHESDFVNSNYNKLAKVLCVVKFEACAVEINDDDSVKISLRFGPNETLQATIYHEEIRRDKKCEVFYTYICHDGIVSLDSGICTLNSLIDYLTEKDLFIKLGR